MYSRSPSNIWLRSRFLKEVYYKRSLTAVAGCSPGWSAVCRWAGAAGTLVSGGCSRRTDRTHAAPAQRCASSAAPAASAGSLWSYSAPSDSQLPSSDSRSGCPSPSHSASLTWVKSSLFSPGKTRGDIWEVRTSRAQPCSCQTLTLRCFVCKIKCGYRLKIVSITVLEGVSGAVGNF